MEDLKLDNTAKRTALWRALHLEIDQPPYLIEDDWALKLADPESGWQNRPDMLYTKSLRASIVARARLIEDRVLAAVRTGMGQYLILGAGLDSLALRHPALTESLKVFEIDQASTLAWKEHQIKKYLVGLPSNLHLLPVNFERQSWWEVLLESAFDGSDPALISCTGVTLYLTAEAIKNMLQHIARMAKGSLALISFYMPVSELEGEDKKLQEIAIKGAAAAGTPMRSFYTEEQVRALATQVGFSSIEILNTRDLIELYFKDRTDDLLPSDGEIFLIVTV